MSKSSVSLKVDRIDVFNLWGKDKVSLKFNEKVTFLTGLNGSGKSTLLNIIFDSLICDPFKFSKPATSKCRFWSSQVFFDNGSALNTLILPRVIDDIIEAKDVKALLDKSSTFDLETVKELQVLFEKASSDKELTYISHKSELKGEWWAKTVSEDSPETSRKILKESAPLGFLFQEDRTTLHNMENCSTDRSSFYWHLYSSSIDERFAYCRDALHVTESFYSNTLTNKLLEVGDKFSIEQFLESDSVKIATNSNRQINNLIKKLNQYFSEIGKCVVRDHENKITLGKICESNDEQPSPMSWNLLSRGEKTLLYLFFAVYCYKDKVAVFLLDEPEISFHVNWQKRLIRDLCEIAPNNQFIIATHSPSLVMDGWLPNCLELKV